MTFYNCLKQWSTNHGLQCLFCKENTGTQSHVFAYILSVATFLLPQQNWVVVTETIQPSMSKIFTTQILTNNSIHPKSKTMFHKLWNQYLSKGLHVYITYKDKFHYMIEGYPFFFYYECLEKHLGNNLIWDV